MVSKILSIPKIGDGRGNLSVIERDIIPFAIKRVYFLYDIPQNVHRGGHSHKEQKNFIVAVSGSFEVVLDNGKEKKTFQLDKPNEGLYVEKNTWRELKNFSSGAVCLVVSSGEFDENDYIRDYNDFLEFLK